MAVCLALTHAISRSRTVEEIYTAALDALERGLAVPRSSILLFDPDGVMRFKAYRGLSDAYRRAVEGHTPWSPDTPDPQPIVVADVSQDRELQPYLPVFAREGIAAMAFIPLVSLNRVIGKFMLYYAGPHDLTPEELQLAGVVAAQVAFAVERTRAEEKARRSEERLRFALEAAAMGTWDWDVGAQQVRWSENLERVHGLEAGTFDGTFASYEREIHPEDRDRVLASLSTAITTGAAHEVEYRVVGPDGSVRWLEAKGRVEHENGAVRMMGVCMAVTRRKEAELERIAAAEETSRLKDEFLATLSHELRTPLNAILGWVQMLQSEQLSADRMRHAIDVMGRNARLQAQLIEDILDVSRIIAGKLEIERLPVHLPQLVETATAAVLPAASAKQIRLATDIAPHLPPIEGDPKRLQQVLGNVLGNAIKFTPDGGQISVSCSADADAIVIAVQDSGVGLSPEFLPFVFDRFRQADSRSTRRHGGLGLGLAIARHLVELHGGSIQASSAGPNRGTTVHIRIPAGTQPAHVLERPGAAGVTRGHDDALRLDGRRVLVVDDHRDSRELLAAVFDARGAEVAQCVSAAAALAHLGANDVHLLVADIAMPEVDGYELIRRVRQMRKDVPAIAVSAYARPEDRYRALATGYDAYCAKPFTAAEVLRQVGRVLVSR